MPTAMTKKLTKLYQIAESQHGYFTAKQAAKSGFLPTNFTYHVKSGKWIHEGTGIYRLKNFPTSRESYMVLYALWSRNREDQIQGIYSHDTALSLYELSDVNPSKLHLSVPKSFRKSTDTPKVLKLHFENLKTSDVQTINGLKVTKPLRTLIDTFNDVLSKEFVEQAVVQAYSRGLVTKSDIKSAKIPSTTSDQFLKWIAWAEKNRRK